ncbi:MAG: SDR family NAD(P)-dependent oxidoreductase, partial [Spongiibacteraceae bacterium]
MNRLNGKVAVVTGAGKGIGRAIALRFGREGAKVVVSDLRASDCASVVEDITRAGGTAYAITADLGRHEGATLLIEQAGKYFGALDILVHNAGIYPHVPLEQLTDDVLDATLNLNLKACFWLTLAATPMLKRSADGGRVVMMSSSTGTDNAVPGLAHYAASKAGMTGFVKS